MALAPLLLATPTIAQPAGDIHGIVIEQAAGPLAGVAIVATSTATGATRQALTGEDGRFTLSGLPAGTYDISATLAGFAAVRQEGLAIGSGRTIASRLEMRKAAQDETIRLEAAPPALEPLRPVIADTIAAVEVAHLPLASRNPLDLVRLSPLFVHEWNASLASVSLPSSLTSLSVDGSSSRYPSSSLAAVGGFEVSRDAITDIQASITPPVSVLGNAGAAIEVVTRSGAQTFSGTAFEMFRTGRLKGQSRTSLEAGRPRPSLRGNQFGGTVGGPLLRERHYFFASYDGVRERDENEVFLDVPDVAADPATALALSRLAPLSSNWRRTRDQQIFLVRTDHRIGASRLLTVRYHRVAFDGDGLAASGPRRSIEATGPAVAGKHSLSGYAGLPMGAVFSDLRLSFVSDRSSSETNSALPSADIREAGATLVHIGSNPLGSSHDRTRSIRAADIVMGTIGAHTLKAGFDVRWDRRERTFAAFNSGAYVFQSLAGFSTGTPSGPGDTFTQMFAANGASAVSVNPHGNRWALFVQDRWLLRDDVTIDASLKYERDAHARQRSASLQPLLAAGLDAGTVPTDGDNWAPRVGIAWAPSSRYVLRAAYDVSYAPTPDEAVVAAHIFDGADVRMVSLRGAEGDLVPTYPAMLPVMPSSARSPLVTFSNAFENPRLRYFSGGVDWEWMPSTVVSLNYLNARGESLTRAVESSAGATPFGRVVLFNSSGRSEYQGVSVEMRRRMSQGFQYRLGYTISKATDNGLFVGPFVPETIDDRFVHALSEPDEQAPAPGDRGQRFLASFVIFSQNFAERRSGVLKTILDDWRLGAIYTLRTGLAYTAYVSDDQNGDGNRFNDIAPGTARQQFRTGREGRMDTRFVREFKLPRKVLLTASLDVFNLLNSAHYRATDDVMFGVNGSGLVPNPLFGRRYDELDARTMQLGVGVTF